MLKLAFLGITGISFLLTLWSHEVVAPVSAQQPASLLQCSPLEVFNESIQKRFLNADVAFGMSRVMSVTPLGGEHKIGGLGAFKPNNEEEVAAVSDLHKGGWQVGFYLVGRKVTGEQPQAETWKVHPQHGFSAAPIKGPMEITGNLSEADLPEPKSLWAQSQQAMKFLARQEQYAFTSGKWSFSARPIRARAECLKCHVSDSVTKMRLFTSENKLLSEGAIKTGDVLGVALYAYRLSNRSNK
jgi:hypothetical protein